MNKTIFEKIIDREILASILYEDEKMIVFLDAFPFEKGHILVVPKKVYETIWEMPEDEYLELQKIVLKFAKKMYEKMECGINIQQNNLKIADQEIPYVHFHIIPRVDKNKKMFFDTKDRLKYFDEKEKKSFEQKLKID
jgi:histidine triad (HIT) family protein